jgi:hypothetical protein
MPRQIQPKTEPYPPSLPGLLPQLRANWFRHHRLGVSGGSCLLGSSWQMDGRVMPRRGRWDRRLSRERCVGGRAGRLVDLDSAQVGEVGDDARSRPCSSFSATSGHASSAEGLVNNGITTIPNPPFRHKRREKYLPLRIQ